MMELDNSLETWLHELEMEDPSNFFPEFHTKKMSSSSSSSGVDEIPTKQIRDTELIEDQKLYQYSYSGLHPPYDHQPSSKPETSSPLGFTTTKSLSMSREILTTSEAGLSFSDLASVNWIDFDAAMNNGQEVTPSLPLPPHIVVERKRREDLNQRYLTLSNVIPGLKKRDKASILGEAVKYMKDLQERIKSLEEKSKKKVVESVVFVPRSPVQLLSYNNINTNNYSYTSYSESDDDNFSNNNTRLLPEIEAKVLERSVLIRVHCENNKGILPRLLSVIAKLHLIVVTTNVIPFGNDTDITVIAQMGADFCIRTKDIVEYLIKTNLTKFHLI